MTKPDLPEARLSKRLSPPSGAAIESFSDLLADAPDLQGVCQAALNFALTTTAHPSGVLFAQSVNDRHYLSLARRDISPEWATQLSRPFDPLHQLVQTIIRSGEYIVGEAAARYHGLPNLAAAVPLETRSGIQGALLIEGEICSPVEVDWLLKLSRPIGRAIRLSRTGHAPQDPPPSAGQPGEPALLEALLNNLPGYMYIINSAYELVAFNASMANRVGQDYKTLRGRLCYQAIYQRSEVCLDCMAAETLKSGKGTIRTAARPSTDRRLDDPTTWEIRSYPVFASDGRVEQTILLEQDITDRRELEEVVAQSGKLAALGQLAAGVAHEINNPLTAIIANAQILQRELPADDERRESVDLIALAGARAAQVVRNLLDFARKEQDQRAMTNVNDTLRSALALVQHELISRAISIQISLDEKLPHILAAPDSLQGVWLNLLLNALESIDKIPGSICVSSQLVGEDVHVSITDNGRGIPAERLERIFQPFYTTKAPGLGTGLGLSVCTQIVEKHAGRIMVESQVGQGSEFRVVLPVSHKPA